MARTQQQRTRPFTPVTLEGAFASPDVVTLSVTRTLEAVDRGAFRGSVRLAHREATFHAYGATPALALGAACAIATDYAVEQAHELADASAALARRACPPKRAR